MPEMTPEQRHDAYWRVVAAALPIAVQLSVRPASSGLVATSGGQQMQAATVQPEVAAKIALKLAATVVAEYEVGT